MILLLWGCVVPPSPQQRPATRPSTPAEPMAPPVRLPPETLIAQVPASDWPAICAEVALPRASDLLACNGFEVPVPALDTAGAIDLCVARYGGAASHPTCSATLADLAVVEAEPITCTTLLDPSPEELRVRGCVAEPPRAAPVCVELAASAPDDGAVEDGPSDVRLVMDGEDPSVVVEVFEADTGARREGETRVEGAIHGWVPDAPLRGGRSYEVETRWCGGFRSERRSFSTTPDPPTLPADAIVGRTWLLEIDHPGVRWVRPAVLRSLFVSLLDGPPLVHILDADTELAVRVGTGNADAQQDLCLPTHTTEADFTGNPRFTDLVLSLSYDGAPLGPLQVEGELARQGGVARVVGHVDTRPTAAHLDLEPDALCELLDAIGDDCEPCSDGVAACVPFLIEHVPLEPVDTSLTPRAPDAVEQDLACAL